MHRTFCENLKGVPQRFVHGDEDFHDGRRWNGLVEKVGHRVDEDNPRLFPAERGIEEIFVNCQLKSIAVPLLPMACNLAAILSA